MSSGDLPADVVLPNPLKLYDAWFAGLPHEVQFALGLQIVTRAPSGIFTPAYDAVAQPAVALRARLAEHEPSAAVGLCVLLRGLTELGFPPNSTEEAGAGLRLNGEELLLADNPLIAATARGLASRFTEQRGFQSRLWMREYESWCGFRDTYFTDKWLRTWERLTDIYPWPR